MQLSKEYLSVTESAELFGVSRQRMHELLKFYDVETEKIGRQFLVARKNLKKIPAKRPTGKHVSARKK